MAGGVVLRLRLTRAVVLLLLLTGSNCSGSRTTTNTELFDYLFAKYNKAIRPIEYTGQATVVWVSPNLYSIIDVNESDETLKFSRWFQMFWLDPMLRWEPREFNGTQELLVEAANIWIPDITIIEMLDTVNAPTPMDYASISYNGTIRYSLNDIITVYCSIDPQEFPYDTQNCSVSYVSWEYPADQILVDALPSSHDYMYFFGESSEWELLAYEYSKPPQITDNATISFDLIRYNIRFQRKAMFYILSLVLPSFLITMVTIFGIFSPSTSSHERSERVSIALTGLLAMSVVLMMVTDILPKSDKAFPVLGQYMLAQMCIMLLSLLLAVAIMYLQASAAVNYPMPQLLLTLFFVNTNDVDNEFTVEETLITDTEKKSGPPSVTNSEPTELIIPEAWASRRRHLWLQSYKPPLPTDKSPPPNGTPVVERPGLLEPPPGYHKRSRRHRDRTESYSKRKRHQQQRESSPSLYSRTTVAVLTRIQHVINKIDVELKNTEYLRVRVEIAQRVCYRIDILFNIIFNVINMLITLYYFNTGRSDPIHQADTEPPSNTIKIN